MREFLRLRALLALACLESCTPPASLAAPAEPPATYTTTGATANAESAEQVSTWQKFAASPQPSEVSDPADRALAELCQRSDRALESVARHLAEREADGAGKLDVGEISFALRSEGSPYVWPRAWLREDLTGRRDIAQQKMQSWLATFRDGGERRCGVASVRKSNGREVIAAVAVDVLADLKPVPARARISTWIDVQAELLVPASQAKVVVLAPRGVPQAIPTSIGGNQVKARFMADRQGAYLVQVLANIGFGPRPVLETIVHAGIEPPRAYQALPAPGEEAMSGGSDLLLSLERMVNAARKSEGLAPLVRHAELDAIAREHAEAMHKEKRVAHDVGKGDPKSRVEASGIFARAAGENVAHAADIQRAHRALWSSPSHRGNLLQQRFDSMGIGIVVDSDSSVWVCEVFAQLR